MIKTTLKVLNEVVRRLVENDEDIDTVTVGDMVDVDTEEMGILPVRVVELVDDVQHATGWDPNSQDKYSHHAVNFTGPGFVGEIDPSSGESGQLVFSANQVVPGSKVKYFFPHLGSELENGQYADWDAYGRETPNPYRKMANKTVHAARARKGDFNGDYNPELDEADADHVGDPRWDDHADPTGKAWDAPPILSPDDEF